MVKIEWTEKSISDIEKLDRLVAKRIVKKLSWLGDNFEQVALEPLEYHFKDAFKLRIGDWRVIYTVENEVIVIQFVGHRSDIYKMK